MSRPTFSVFAIRKGKVWVSAGRAVQAADGSLNVTLDVLPLDGQLHIRPIADQVKPQIFVVLDGADGLVIMEQARPSGPAVKVGELAHGQGHPIDLVYNQALEHARARGAELATNWLRHWRAEEDPT